MYQTPSQWAHGLKSEPSQPVKTSARSGNRQPTGRPPMPMSEAARNATAKMSTRLPTTATRALASGWDGAGDRVTGLAPAPSSATSSAAA